ncbi:MAG: glycosyltransferase [Nanoarchaeota archaeon]|nr:glycosyltransferase [Nanoarchaeota archaeon]MBU1704579.1 glycosyltransferase [Nanoarchaeota archaeon]
MNVTVIIPTLDEEENISKLMGQIKYPVLVVDDGSLDKTQDIVTRSKAGLLDRSGSKTHGLTVSAMEGICTVKTKYFVVMDADFQHPPDKLDEICEQLRSNDIVIGVRRDVKGWPISRKIISKGAEILARFRLLHKFPRIKDPLSGFFGGDSEFCKKIIVSHGKNFEKKGYKILFELLKYCPKNAKIGYVYYNFGLREKGESKIGIKHILLFLKSIFK